MKLEYGGVRLRTVASVAGARITVVVPTEIPDALSRDFGRDTGKRQQWEAFVRDLAVHPGPLDSVIEDLATFLMPIAANACALVQEVG